MRVKSEAVEPEAATFTEGSCGPNLINIYLTMSKMKVQRNLLICFCTFFLSLCFTSGLLLAQQTDKETCLFQGWPSEFSDLAPDPTLEKGVLANGLHYVFKDNNEPKDRVALYLLVKAGSFNETEEQRGVAHFLEHMMFNGTEHFPPGTLIDYFQSIGMEFGGDTNAFTSYDRTVYTIVLPDGSNKNLDTGLLVLSDFAGRALLTEEEIDKERGVILAEKRSRNSADYKSSVASTENNFSGTLLPVRQVIGTDETLNNANRRILKAFYDTWYRPDNMVLVAVGHINKGDVKPLLEKHFGSLVPRTKAYTCPDFGTVGNSTRQPFYYFDKELGETEVSVENFWDEKIQHDSTALQKAELLHYLTTIIMNYRLQDLAERVNAPFTESEYYSGDVVDRLGYAAISATTKGGGWQQSLSGIESVRRQALEYGFAEDELMRAKAEILAYLNKNVKTEKTKDSRKIAREIIDNLASDRVYMAPRQELELYGGMLEKITLADINDAYRRDWSVRNLVVSVSGDTAITVSPQETIATSYRDAEKQSLNARDQYGAISFPYLPVSKLTAGIPKITQFEKIGATRYVFPNGLILNLKKTDFEDKKIRIAAAFGDGELTEPQPGMAMLAERIINDSGTGKLSLSELERVTAGSTVSLGFDIGESSFSWSGQALSSEFELLVELLYTHLFDPGFRENIHQRALTELAATYKRLNQNVDGAFPLKIQRFIAGGSKKFGLPTYDELKNIPFLELAKWVKHLFDFKDLEISVVGDFEEKQAVGLLSKYFGARELPNRSSATAPVITFPAGGKLTIEVPTSFDKSMIAIAWPTADGSDISRTRRLHVLAAILEDRLLDKLREALGATYSPESYSFASRVYKDYGYIMAQMTVAPKDVPAVVQEVLALSESMANNGVTEDELIRARDPLVTSVKESVATNGYWLQTVLNLSSRHPEQLTWPETILSDYASISRDEIDTLAKQFFQPGQAAVAVAEPKTAAKDNSEGNGPSLSLKNE